MSEPTELPMREERCETCRFWEDNDPNETDKSKNYEGWCHRHAPMPLIVVGCRENGQASEHVLRPFTDASDWCGEWKAKDGVKAMPTDASRLLAQLSASAISERLEEMAHQREGLLVLLRAARANERKAGLPKAPTVS